MATRLVSGSTLLLVGRRLIAPPARSRRARARPALPLASLRWRRAARDSGSGAPARARATASSLRRTSGPCGCGRSRCSCRALLTCAVAALLEPEEEVAVPARAGDLRRDGRERLVLAARVLEALDADRHLVGLAVEDAADNGARRRHAGIPGLRRREDRLRRRRRGVLACRVGRVRGLPEAH